jgi:prevent-host-death family protein
MEINATEFKAKCLGLLDHVQESGDVLVISKRGVPVAKLVPMNEDAGWKSLRGKGRFVGNALDPVIDLSEIEDGEW